MSDDAPLSNPVGTYRGPLGLMVPVYAVRRHVLANPMIPLHKRPVVQALVMTFGQLAWINDPQGLQLT